MLNSAQQKAVETTEGRVLVLAGAGSGKTRVIVHRIAHLIAHRRICPDAIVGLTFTNKAAEEMRHRLQEKMGTSVAKQVTLATFHSFCMNILRKEIDKLGFTKNFSLYDERDLERIIKQISKEELGVKDELPSLASTKALIALAGNTGTFPKTTTWHDNFAKTVYEKLQVALRAQNAVNFDNLINLTLRLFEEYPDVLERYQDRYRYFMIDEYQDTNPSQFRLAELLSAKYRNLCVVGDDDQSIYGWRGAEIANILEFKADHVIKLEQNYRSTPVILAAANAVIKNNRNRHDKNLWTSSATQEAIEVFNAPTEVEEANAVIQRILRYKEQGFQWKDIAILYRSNALSRNFEMALMNASWKESDTWVRGIPYAIFGGLEFSERSEIKDLLAYLRVLSNPQDEEAMLRIINVPRRGISEQFLDELTLINRSSDTPLWDILRKVSEEKLSFPTHPKGVLGIKNFVELVERFQYKFSGRSLHETLTSLLEEMNYKKAIEEEVKSDKMRAFKWENVQECVNALAQYEQQENEPSLQDFVSGTMLGKPRFTKDKADGKQDAVQLMTLHSAKGLEFPICFIVGLEDHILPHEKSKIGNGIEEERRLFYVGITRSRTFLHLSMARARMQMGKASPTNPSRFLFEIPKHLLKVAKA